MGVFREIHSLALVASNSSDDRSVENFTIAPTSALQHQEADKQFQSSAPVEHENLFQAVQELGTALRKERAYSQKLCEELEQLHAARQKETRAQHQALKEASDLQSSHEATLSQLRAENKKQELERQNLQNQIRELEAQLRQSAHREAEEREKIRFEQEIQKTSQTYHHQKHRQLQIENEELRAHFIRIQQENRHLTKLHQQLQAQAAADQRVSDENQKALLKKIAELNTELAQYRSEWSRQIQTQTQLQNAMRTHQLLTRENEQLKLQLAHPSHDMNALRLKVADLEHQLENERNEKHMVLATLRTSEIKLSRMESRHADLEQEFERLRERTPLVQDEPAVHLAGATRAVSAKSPRKPHDPTDLDGPDLLPNSIDSTKFFVAYPEIKGEA